MGNMTYIHRRKRTCPALLAGSGFLSIHPFYYPISSESAHLINSKIHMLGEKTACSLLGIFMCQIGLETRLLTTSGAYSLLAMIQQIGDWRDLSEKIVQWKG
jgi:hypothetical protein